jgi:IS5 family transposase
MSAPCCDDSKNCGEPREIGQFEFVNFRKRLRETGHASTLFDGVLEQLRAQGLGLQEGSLVDATIVEQSTGQKNEHGESTRDRCASFTKKHGKTYHGYKAHVNANPERLILDYVFDTAKVHDSRHIDDLTEDEDDSVYADSAYMSKQRSKRLNERGVHDGIVQRRVRGQDDLTEDQKQHNKQASKVRALVEHPFAWMAQMGYGKARYRGLARNGLDFGLTAMAYNIKRSLSLLGMGLSPPKLTGSAA